MRLPAGSGNNVEIRKHQGRPAKLPFLMFLILRSMIDRDGGMISQSGNDPNPPDALIELADHAGDPGEDTGKQDHGDAVADAELGDLLAQPHDEGGAGHKGGNDDDGGPHALGGQEAVFAEGAGADRR